MSLRTDISISAKPRLYTAILSFLAQAIQRSKGSPRQINEAIANRIEDLVTAIGRLAHPARAQPITQPTTPSPANLMPCKGPPGATPASSGGTKRRRDRVSPATHRNPKAVGIALPPATLMHSKHAAAERPPPLTRAKCKGKETDKEAGSRGGRGEKGEG